MCQYVHPGLYRSPVRALFDRFYYSLPMDHHKTRTLLPCMTRQLFYEPFRHMGQLNAGHDGDMRIVLGLFVQPQQG